MTTFKEYLDIVSAGEETNLFPILKSRKTLERLPKPLTPEQLKIAEQAQSAGLQVTSKTSTDKLINHFYSLKTDHHEYTQYEDKKALADLLGVPLLSVFGSPERFFSDYKAPKKKEEINPLRHGRMYRNHFHPDCGDDEPECLIINEHGEWIIASVEEKRDQGYKFSIPIDELIHQLERQDLI